MRNIIRKILLELINKNDTTDYEHIFNYKENIYFLNDDEELPEGLINDFNLGDVDYYDFEDTYELIEYLRDKSNINIIHLTVDDSDTLRYSVDDFSQNPFTSVQFKKLLLHLSRKNGYKYIYIDSSISREIGDEYFEDTTDELYLINQIIKNKKDINVKLPKKMYHGTSSAHIEEILKKGLLSRVGTTNFDSIDHEDINYLIDSKTKAIFYADNATRIEDGVPIILEFDTTKLDTSKMILDYDIYVDYVRDGTIERYDDIFYGTGSNRPLVKLDDIQINNPTKFDRFGYVGRIPASFITNVYYNFDSTQHDFSSTVDMADTDDFIKDLDMIEQIFNYDDIRNNYTFDLDEYMDYEDEF